MPIISQFYGISIAMYANEYVGKHNKSHIHVIYNEYKAIYDLEGILLEGEIPYKQKKMVEAWILIHQNELKYLWDLLQRGGNYFKISPLK